MSLLGIHHVAVIAADYARSRDFYVRILGLEVIAENYRDARDSWKLDLRLPMAANWNCSPSRTLPHAPAARKPADCATSPSVSRRWTM